ncbi:MAG: methyltransferase domain-containing protein [Sulfurovaceae bacterium]|nr:methyltransferase domain-containing protein [Sulfurovaceae bacterium]
MKKFTIDSLLEIKTWLHHELEQNNQLSFEIPNPDHHRGYKRWVNLAELHHCRMLTPLKIDENTIQLTFKKLNLDNSFHTTPIEDREEKYGTSSKFFDINKNEEPTFLYAYHKALEAVKVKNRKHILNLGINKGDEFELIEQMLDIREFEKIEFSGIDHSTSALAYAKERFPTDNVQFYKQDINKIKELHLNKADLIISIGTFQSPSINYKPFLMSLVQEHLSYDGAFILGFPNSRWIDGDLIYGAKAPNYPYSEMSLLFNDVIFAKKYLQQKKFRVTITGREYIFLTATRIGI